MVLFLFADAAVHAGQHARHAAQLPGRTGRVRQALRIGQVRHVSRSVSRVRRPLQDKHVGVSLISVLGDETANGFAGPAFIFVPSHAGNVSPLTLPV